MSEPQDVWNTVDDWIEQRFVPEDAALENALAASTAGGLPEIAVSAAQGRLLELLVRMSGARSVLEVGTLGGYSTIWLARGVPAGGRVLTLEISGHHADVARANLAAAGLADVVEARVGPAGEALKGGGAPFRLRFLDAPKPGA